jgi:hypothetical protein
LGSGFALAESLADARLFGAGAAGDSAAGTARDDRRDIGKWTATVDDGGLSGLEKMARRYYRDNTSNIISYDPESRGAVNISWMGSAPGMDAMALNKRFRMV